MNGCCAALRSRTNAAHSPGVEDGAFGNVEAAHVPQQRLQPLQRNTLGEAQMNGQGAQVEPVKREPCAMSAGAAALGLGLGWC